MIDNTHTGTHPTSKAQLMTTERRNYHSFLCLKDAIAPVPLKVSVVDVTEHLSVLSRPEGLLQPGKDPCFMNCYPFLIHVLTSQSTKGIRSAGPLKTIPESSGANCRHPQGTQGVWLSVL